MCRVIAIILLINSLSAEESLDQQPQYEWVEGNEVFIREDGIYIDTNKGMMRLNVVEYDKGNDRYLVKRSSKSYLDDVERLGDFSEKAE